MAVLVVTVCCHFRHNEVRLTQCCSFGIDPDKADLAAIRKCFSVVKNGEILGIFPEGTRNKTEEQLLPFKEGSLKIAEKTGCLIIPVAMNNTAEIFENHAPWIRKCRVVIEYGAPIDPKTLSKEDKKRMGAICREKIQEMLDKNQKLVS